MPYVIVCRTSRGVGTCADMIYISPLAKKTTRMPVQNAVCKCNIQEESKALGPEIAQNISKKKTTLEYVVFCLNHQIRDEPFQICTWHDCEDTSKGSGSPCVRSLSIF